MSSGFFQHRGATPPASWWSADVAGSLEGVEAAAEEHTFGSAGEVLPGPDVVGHDPVVVTSPMLSEAGLDPALSARLAKGLARMLAADDACELALRRTQASHSQPCPAGLLFASPRPAWNADASKTEGGWPQPIPVKLRPMTDGLAEAEVALLRAAVANLANRPADAARELGPIIPEDPAVSEPLRALLQREREAAAILAGDCTASLGFAYHRVVAQELGWCGLDVEETVQAIESMDETSPWRWAALRLVVPRLQQEAPQALSRLIGTGA